MFDMMDDDATPFDYHPRRASHACARIRRARRTIRRRRAAATRRQRRARARHRRRHAAVIDVATHAPPMPRCRLLTTMESATNAGRRRRRRLRCIG